MKSSFKYFILFAIFLNVLIAQTAERMNMAIYNFTGLGVSPIEAQVISDRIRVEISKLDVYSIIERGLMEQILKEQVLQLSGLCDDASCLVEVGQILAVQYIVGGSVSKIGNLFTIEARIIDVESCEIITNVVEDYNGPIENLLVQTTRIVAAKLCGTEPEESAPLLTGTCDLYINSEPTGGTIYINDKPVGDVTPYRLEGLSDGEIKIQVKKGAFVGETVVSLARNERRDVIVVLEQEKFIMRINSIPEGAIVTINNSIIGKTPIDYSVIDTTSDYKIKLSGERYFDINDLVHFVNNAMLRLNYDLEPSGQIWIPFSEDVSVFLNNREIAEIPNVTIEGGAFLDNFWVIHKLNLTDYSLRIEKDHHLPYLHEISLNSEQRIQKITYNMQIMKANTIIMSNVYGKGELRGGSIIPFELKAEQNTYLEVPFGRYSLKAKAQGYLPIRRELEVLDQKSNPVKLNFQHPSKKVALKRSLLYPGLGQYYSQQPKKGIILGVITSAGIALFSTSISNYDKELVNYNDLAEQYSTATTIEDMDLFRNQLSTSGDRLNGFRSQFMIASSVALISYSWNIFDITARYPFE